MLYSVLVLYQNLFFLTEFRLRDGLKYPDFDMCYYRLHAKYCTS